MVNLWSVLVSVSLRSIIHSYLMNIQIKYVREKKNQVSVSLRSIIHSYQHYYLYYICLLRVSVSLRSIIHSYSFTNVLVIFEISVSVSLRSIIHSYPTVKKVFYCNNFLECYRMIFLFLNFFCLFQLKASLTPLFLNIV